LYNQYDIVKKIPVIHQMLTDTLKWKGWISWCWR